jgi:hypothetical protein
MTAANLETRLAISASPSRRSTANPGVVGEETSPIQPPQEEGWRRSRMNDSIFDAPKLVRSHEWFGVPRVPSTPETRGGSKRIRVDWLWDRSGGLSLPEVKNFWFGRKLSPKPSG